jgi:hypothetical protein
VVGRGRDLELTSLYTQLQNFDPCDTQFQEEGTMLSQKSQAAYSPARQSDILLYLFLWNKSAMVLTGTEKHHFQLRFCAINPPISEAKWGPLVKKKA